MYLPHEGFVEKYFYWFAHEEPYIPYKTIVERMIGSTSCSKNVHKVVDENNNPYSDIVKCNENKSVGNISYLLLKLSRSIGVCLLVDE